MKILHLEDSTFDAELIGAVLHREWPDCAVKHVTSSDEYLEALRGEGFDVILSDYSMPGYDGLLALGEARTACPRTPFLFVSGMIGEERAVEALKHGATDYIIKDRPARLVPAIRQALAFATETALRRHTEDVLRENDERFQLITESVVEHISLLDARGRRVYSNRACRDVFGEAAVAPGSDWLAVIDPADAARARDVFHRALGSGKSEHFEYRARRFDGAVRHLEATAAVLRNAAGEIAHVAVVSRDITERREAELKLREQASLLDKARDAIIATDLAHRVTYWNASAERLYGVGAAEAVGRKLDELGLGFDPAKFAAARRDVIAAGEWRGEFALHTRSGASVLVESTWSLVVENDGQPRSIMTIDTDITERRRLEGQLLLAQRLESVGTLAGGVAHDLNNVLTPILCTLDLFSIYVRTPEEREILEKTRASAQHGAALIRQLLGFARGTEGERTTVDPARALVEVEPLLRQFLSRAIDLRIRSLQTPWPIRANPTQLNQALINLALNARDAMPAGGRLEITTENVEVSAAMVAGNPGVVPGSFLRITVVDTGEGVPPDILDRIFDPFFTTKPTGKGTGLGLSTVVGILKSHGGFVQVESEPHHGTSFHLYFPAVPVRPAPPNNALSQPNAQGEGVLLVDDEPAVRDALRALLQRAGYAIYPAEDAGSAVREFEHCRDRISLVITDMMLPDGSGLDVVRTLRSMSPKLPIIAISGMMGSGRFDELHHLQPPVECLSKPLLPRVLLNAAERALHPAAAAK